MPELDLKASLTLLAVSAITGSFLFLMVVVILLFPSVIWIIMLRTSEPLKKLMSDQDGKLLYQRLCVWLCLPICVSLAVSTISILLNTKGIGTSWIEWVGFAVICFGGGGIPAWCLHRKLRGDLDTKEKRNAIGIFLSNLFPCLSFFFISLAILTPLMKSTLTPILPTSYPDMTSIVFMAILTLAACGIVFFDALIVYAFFEEPAQRLLRIIAFIVFLIGFLGLIGLLTHITKTVMYIYKFGNLNGASLVLNESGCTIAKYHGFLPSTILKEGTCRLECVMIHSRLGNSYYVDTGRSNSPSKCYAIPSPSPCFTIPAQNVLSWGTASKGMLEECASRFSSPSSSGSLTPSP
jgi:hypothetical protein